MKIINISIRNFKSFGPDAQVLQIDNPGELLMLLGNNGTGKSSISDAIIFALYGKNARGKISDLTNWNNEKEMEVELNILAKGKLLKIIRGTSKFDLYINGVLYDQAGKSTLQAYIEREFYDIPYHVFRNLLILSINDFKSFLNMKPADKRKITDKLFGFSIINEMEKINKKNLNNATAEKEKLLLKIEHINTNIGGIKENISKLIDTIEKEDNDKKNKTEAQIIELKKQISNDLARIKEASEHLDKMKEVVSVINRNISDLKSEKKSLEHRLKLYENDQCPTCQSKLSTSFHKDIKHDLELKYNITKQKLSQSLDEFKEQSEKVNELSKSIQTAYNLLSKKKADLAVLNSIIDSLGDTNKNKEKISQLKSIILEQELSRNQTITKYKRSSAKEKFYEISAEILSEDGVKKLAIKQIVPKLNTLLKEQIKNMHLPYTVEFDEEFNAKMFCMTKEISPLSLSTGEKKKFDFAILASIIKLIKLKYRTINLIFLDEIFSSVDAEGKYEILQILYMLVKELRMTGIVMNQSELPVQFFTKKIILSKDPYSKIEEVEI